jgi:hypothetical protein
LPRDAPGCGRSSIAQRDIGPSAAYGGSLRQPARQISPALLSAATATCLIALAGAGSAQAKPQKPPKYKATIEVTAHTQAAFDCEADWSSNWVFSGTYSATTLSATTSLDAVTRTASGAIQWTRYFDCAQVLDAGTCSLGVEPPVAGAAGYEDGYLRKTAGGYRVELQVDNAVIPTESPCHGNWWGLNHPYVARQYTEPRGFLPKGKIGNKRIVVPVAGAFGANESGRVEDGQMNGTVTFTRKGKR